MSTWTPRSSRNAIALSALLCLFLGKPLLAQESCTNCEDDDGDGLVDCHDPDCHGDLDACGSHFLVSGADEPVDCDPLLIFAEVWRVPAWSSVPHSLHLVADLDADGVVEVIDAGNLDVRDGRDGTLLLTRPEISPLVAGQAVLGDVDLDGTVEIFKARHGRDLVQVARFEHDLSLTYHVDEGGPAGSPYHPWPSLIDADHDGWPELLHQGSLHRPEDGSFLMDVRRQLTRNAHQVMMADLLPDDACAWCTGLELTTGDRVYSVDLSTGRIQLEESLGSPGGRFALADWDGDHSLDILSVVGDYPGQALVWNPRTDRALRASLGTPPQAEILQVPCIADFDGDGELEAVFTIHDHEPVMPDGLDAFLRVVDNDFSILVDIPIEENSGWTSSSAFDFDSDGAAEIVHRGSEFLTIWNLAGGLRQLAEFPCGSGTVDRGERTTVADINGDGDADMLSGCEDGPLSELVAWTGIDSAPARAVMNQYEYFNVNINDDLTIPCHQQDHAAAGIHRSLTGFLWQAPLMRDGSPNSDECRCGGPITVAPTPPSPLCEEGGPVMLDAVSSTSCTSGVLYRWIDEDGEVLCDWSPETTCAAVVDTTRRYRVTIACAEDAACWSSAQLTVNVAHPPTELTAGEIDPCNRGIDVSWNAAGWSDPSIGGVYRVHRDQGDDPAALSCENALLAAPLVTDLTTSQWLDESTSEGQYHLYLVEAHDLATDCLMRTCLGEPVLDTQRPPLPDGVYATLRVANQGEEITAHWAGARELGPTESYALLKTRHAPTELFFQANPVGDTSRSHSELDLTASYQAFDLRVANGCGELSEDEYPPTIAFP